MRLRQAKKIMGWCKGEGNWHSKDHRKSFGRDVKNYVHPIITIGASLFSHHFMTLTLSVERTQGFFDG